MCLKVYKTIYTLFYNIKTKTTNISYNKWYLFIQKDVLNCHVYSYIARGLLNKKILLLFKIVGMMKLNEHTDDEQLQGVYASKRSKENRKKK